MGKKKPPKTVDVNYMDEEGFHSRKVPVVGQVDSKTGNITFGEHDEEVKRRMKGGENLFDILKEIFKRKG